MTRLSPVILVVWGCLWLGGIPGRSEPLPITLAEAQSRALATSPTLREYRSRKAEARHKVDEVYTQVNPTLNFNANVTRQTPSATFSLGPQTVTFIQEYNYNLGLSLRQAIYTFGRLKWGAASAELQERASQAELLYQQSRVLEEASIAYYEARQGVDQVRVAEDSLKARSAHLKDAEMLVESGVAAPFDAIRDTAALAVAEQGLVEAQNRREVALVRLQILMGQAPGRSLSSEEHVLKSPPTASEVNKAIQQRQDLAAARFARDAARARVELAGTASNPSLTLQSDLIQHNAVGFTPGNQWNVGLVLGIPLYDGGVTETRIAQAKEVAEQLDAIHENAERQVRLEVESLYLDLLTAWKKIEVAERSLASARESSRLATLRYQNGLSTNVELLDATAAMTRAELDLVSARYQYLIGWAHYRRAGGEP